MKLKGEKNKRLDLKNLTSPAAWFNEFNDTSAAQHLASQTYVIAFGGKC